MAGAQTPQKGMLKGVLHEIKGAVLLWDSLKFQVKGWVQQATALKRAKFQSNLLDFRGFMWTAALEI